MIDISGKKVLPGNGFKTPNELARLIDKKDLTDKDLEYLFYLRGEFHNFKCDRHMINSVMSAHINEPSTVIFLDINGTLYSPCGNGDNVENKLLGRKRIDSSKAYYIVTHYNEPSTVIMLDIKGTLYDGGTHGVGNKILARTPAGDYKPISYSVIEALGNMIDRTRPQDLHIEYNLNGYEICPTERAYQTSLIERPLERMEIIPGREEWPALRPKYMTKSGPFTVAFVSTDSVETQRNIIALFYYVYIYLQKKLVLRMATALDYNFNYKYEIADEFAEGTILEIEELLDSKYNNDFMKFLEYEDDKFACLGSEKIKEFKETIDGLFFLSAAPQEAKTKEQLMEEFLRSDTLLERAGYNYKVCAIGDDYDQDGGMLRQAFLRGGFGFICGNPDRTSTSKGVNLARDLSKLGIDLTYNPVVESFSDFYKMLINELVVKRENELIEAMTYANHNVEAERVLQGLNVPCCLKKIKTR